MVLGSLDKDWEEGLVSRGAVVVIGLLNNGVWFGSLEKVRLIPHTLL